jgi:hypothetical protein
VAANLLLGHLGVLRSVAITIAIGMIGGCARTRRKTLRNA